LKRFTEPLHKGTTTAVRVDIHQHLWPEPLLRGLSRRTNEPCITRHREGWTLRIDGEPEAPLDLRDHDPERRAALADADGIDLALVALSPPLGIETLPAAEAEPLLAAYHEGVAVLPSRFGAWAAVGLADPDPRAVSELLDRGFAGACVPADALDSPEGFERLGALLPTMGGQTALNCALSLRRQGTLEKFDVEMIGATADRNTVQAMVSIDIPKSYVYWIVCAAFVGISIYAGLRVVKRSRGELSDEPHTLTLD
jgi:hypothetical protein